jgi:hypothetical protein
MYLVGVLGLWTGIIDFTASSNTKGNFWRLLDVLDRKDINAVPNPTPNPSPIFLAHLHTFKQAQTSTSRTAMAIQSTVQLEND